MTKADISNGSEVSQLIDLVTNFKVTEKRLIIATPELNIASIQNKTINFNVAIHHTTKGIVPLQLERHMI